MLLLLHISCLQTSSKDTAEAPPVTETEVGAQTLSTLDNGCSVLEEPVLDTSTGNLVHLAPHLLLYHDGESVNLFDAGVNEVVSLGSFQHLDGTIVDSSQMLFSFDGEIYTYKNDIFEQSVLESLLPVPIQYVESHQQDVWLWGTGALFRWNKESLYQINVDERDVLDVVFSVEEIFLATPTLQVLALNDNSVEVVEHRNDITPHMMVANHAEELWVSTRDKKLHRRTVQGQWTTFDSGILGEVDVMMGDPLSTKIWIQSGSDAWVLENSTLCSVDVDDGDWLSVDSLGRLLQQTEEGVQRVSIDRPVSVVNMMYGEVLEIQKEIQFLPTDTATLEHFSVWVDDVQLLVDEEPYRTELDPEDYLAGTHELRLIAQGPEGTTVSMFPFITDVLPSSTWSDVEPILLANCIFCHQSDALNPLDTREQWEIYIDEIITEVSAGTMPLGGTPLSNENIVTIRGWKQGGFQ